MKDFIPIQNWFLPTKEDKKPFIIAGPCSAETEEQLISTVSSLKETGKVHMLRAGVWKPRTRPNSFEGVGQEGLKWLKKASQQTGLPVCTEVANTKHVEASLKEGVDVLWLGARTVVSPFSVQEIAEALRGTNVPVMIKNPVNPDLKLWIGAIERFVKSGLQKIAAIHRGFSWFDNTPFRNAPRWGMPIELKTMFPNLSIICDPSHIAGKVDTIEEICQKALDLEMDGLMIESHINPQKALSDPEQQLTPKALNNLLERLTIRQNSSNKINGELESLRGVIDEIDVEILRKFQERMAIIDKIGIYKRENNITILQLQRWKEIVDTRIEIAQSLNINAEFVKKYLRVLHEESIRLQTQILSLSEA